VTTVPARGPGRAAPLDRPGDPAPWPVERLRDSTAARIIGDTLRRTAQPALWLLLAVVILAPCVCFLVTAFSPQIFDQVPAGDAPHWWIAHVWTWHYFAEAVNGSEITSLLNSIWVACAAAAIGIAIGFPIAWMLHRADVPFRRLLSGAMWLVLIVPSWVPSEGWETLVAPDSMLFRAHLGAAWETRLVMGPCGVVLVLGLRAVPFAYLAITAALGGLGQEFEDAARTHGANRWQAIRLVAPILAPAIWSAVAIGFAETIGDFGVAATLANRSGFRMATYELYQNIGNYPGNFPVAAAVGTLLVATVAIPLSLQAKALRGRSYAVLSGRSRQVQRKQMTARGKAGALGLIGGFYLFAIGVPAFGAVSASVLPNIVTSLQPTFGYYTQTFTDAAQYAPFERSLAYGLVTASVTVVAGFIGARLLTRQRTTSTKVLDFMLLAVVALPSVVFGAGYILFYNLPALSRVGLDLYQTVTLLVLAYTASSLPTNARILVGPVSQIQPSLHDSARVHGAGALRAWAHGVIPAVSRPIVMAWLLTFTGVFLELPLSELLEPFNAPPLSVQIQNDSTYHYSLAMAETVSASLIALLAVGVVLGAYRLLAPAGWRRIGGAARG
jgi:iron(III) transport system permease protein